MKNYIIIISIVLILAVGLKLIEKKIVPVPEPVVCTMEAKLCPDGSYVGRSGPKCEFAQCPTGSTPGSGGILPYNSGVSGQVLLGPTCPVERIPPDPACADKGYETTVQATIVGRSSPFATINTDKEGRFTIMLPPGSYTIEPVGGKVLPRCETKSVTISPGVILQTNLSCDSGIR